MQRESAQTGKAEAARVLLICQNQQFILSGITWIFQ